MVARGWGEREGMGEGGKMTQTLYAHMNIIKKEEKTEAQGWLGSPLAVQ
jgi:hypothetical protein